MNYVESNPGKEIFDLQGQIGKAVDGVLYVSPIKTIPNLPSYTYKDNYTISLYSNDKIEQTNLADQWFKTIFTVQYEWVSMWTISIITYKNGDDYKEHVKLTTENWAKEYWEWIGLKKWKEWKNPRRFKWTIMNILIKFSESLHNAIKHQEALSGWSK